MTLYVTVTELHYSSPAKNSDKYYTVFLCGKEWKAHYGRNGTNGTWRHQAFSNNGTAAQGANQIIHEKIRKGYVVVNEGRIAVERFEPAHLTAAMTGVRSAFTDPVEESSLEDAILGLASILLGDD